jgi:hypothetical protein
MMGDKVPMPVLDYAQEQCIDLHMYAVTCRYIILLIFDLIPVDYGYHRELRSFSYMINIQRQGSSELFFFFFLLGGGFVDSGDSILPFLFF